MKLLRRLLGRDSAAEPLPQAWPAILRRHVIGYLQLEPDELQRLHESVRDLVRNKYWEGCGGLELTEDMQVAIAGNAALMALGFPGYRFPNLSSVLVYPGGFFVEDSSGGRELLDGQASHQGLVAISWYEPEDPVRTAEVVVHELAHLFDMLDGEADGRPPLPSSEVRAWEETFQQEFERFVEEDAKGVESVLTPYAATSRSEFFAMSSERFFIQPTGLQQERPDLYELLRRWYGQDPVAGIGPDRPEPESAETEPDPEERIRELEALLRRTPDYSARWEELGGLLASLGRWEEAESAFTALLRLQPGNADAFYQRGNCRDWLDRTDAALADFERAIELLPEVPAGYVARANLRFAESDFEGAFEDLARALALDPEDAEIFGVRARFRHRQGDAAGAKEDCRRALELVPDQPDATWCLGEILSDAGQHAAALEQAELAIERFRARVEDPPADCYVLRGFSRLHCGHYGPALEDIEEALAIDPDSAEAIKIRAQIRCERGELDASLADCDEAIRRDPDYAQAYRLRARLHRRQGRPERAAEDEERASSNPRSPRAPIGRHFGSSEAPGRSLSTTPHGRSPRRPALPCAHRLRPAGAP